MARKIWAKDQPKVSAVSTMELCWERLAKVYGDKTNNVITVKGNLKAFIPKGSLKWEKVISLHDQVEIAMDQLKVISAQELRTYQR